MMRQFNSFIHLMDIAGNPHHINCTICSHRNIIQIDATNICHGRQFQFGIILAYDSSQILVCTKLPGSNFVPAKCFFTADVANFHIVNASLNTSEAGVDYMEIGYISSEKAFSRNEVGPWKFCADKDLSLIHISEPTRLGMISYAV